jgi:hypothetical protein
MLRRSWHRESQLDWPDDAEWWTAAVDAVSDALTGGPVDAREACVALGEQRAEAGVGLDEARWDLRTATRLAQVRAPAAGTLVDALTVAWSNRTLDWLASRSSMDPLTGLMPMQYLITRLDELRLEAEFVEEAAAQNHALVVVRLPGRTDPLIRATNMITLGLALRSAFAGGVTLARSGPNSAVALVPRRPLGRLESGLRLLTRELRRAHDQGRLPAARAWVEPLPNRVDSGIELLLRLS